MLPPNMTVQPLNVALIAEIQKGKKFIILHAVTCSPNYSAYGEVLLN